MGISVPAGKKLEFLPGHLIRDTAGRQVSDGILAYRDGGKLVIAAVSRRRRESRPPAS